MNKLKFNFKNIALSLFIFIVLALIFIVYNNLKAVETKPLSQKVNKVAEKTYSMNIIFNSSWKAMFPSASPSPTKSLLANNRVLTPTPTVIVSLTPSVTPTPTDIVVTNISPTITGASFSKTQTTITNSPTVTKASTPTVTKTLTVSNQVIALSPTRIQNLPSAGYSNYVIAFFAIAGFMVIAALIF